MEIIKKKINDDFAVAFKRLQNKNVITFQPLNIEILFESTSIIIVTFYLLFK